ncbi:MAG TPA: LysR family transcriptional regulator [Acidimicrobiales bacterium]|nr:LysR family transcriptional regulator [Acidimicrobiales bacterium]
MDLRQLSALVAIADHGSFSAAADALSTVQSNISAHVKKLEQELNAELVDRSTGALTETGRLVVARARRARAELEALMSDVLALHHDVAGTVRIGIIGTTARWLVPRLLDLTPERFPLLRLIFVESTTTALDSQLASGQVDLAVLNLPQASSELSLTPLFEEDLVFVADPGHPLAASEEISIADLVGVPLLLPYQGTAFRDELERALRPLGARLTSRAEVDGTRLIASLVFEGYGPAILPATAVPGYLRDRWAMVRVREIPARLVGVAQRARSLPSAPARAVLDLLTSIVFDSGSTPPGLRPVQPDRLRPSVGGELGLAPGMDPSLSAAAAPTDGGRDGAAPEGPPGSPAPATSARSAASPSRRRPPRR